jgi:hypothetical protein
MRSAGVAPSNILNFAITRDRVSSIEHAPPNLRSNFGPDQNRFRVGIGLREIARNMNIPEGTVLAQAVSSGRRASRRKEHGEACREHNHRAL